MSETPSKSKPLAAAAAGVRLGSSTLTLAVSRLGDGFDGRPMVVAAETGERTTPTVVAWSNGEWVLGDAAKQQAAKNPKNTFMNLLKLLGAKADDAAALKLCKGIKVVPEPDTNNLMFQPVDVSSNEPDGAAMSPVTLLSMLLRNLKEIAEENVGGKVGPCTFTVPADLTEVQCENVMKAGSLSGFDVFQLIPEPVAVCLAYKLDASNIATKGESLSKVLKNLSVAAAADAAANDNNNKLSHVAQAPAYVMVVDVGGSDTSATILNVNNGVMNVLALDSSTELSGKIMIEEVLKYSAMFFSRKNSGLDPTESKKSVTRLRHTCEGTLRFLSNAPQADIEVESLYEGLDLRARLSRARFEDMCEWTTLDTVINGVLAKASLTKADIGRVLLAGGAARVPKIGARLNSLFDAAAVAQCMKESPDEAGALGAALQASRLVCDSSTTGAGTIGLFMRDYKKSEHKFHKEIPSKKSIPSLQFGLALKIGNQTFDVVAEKSFLPIRAQCCVLLGNSHLKSVTTNGKGELEVHVVEVNGSEESQLVTFTLNNLKPNQSVDLVSYLSVTVAGQIDFEARAFGSTSDAAQLVQSATESEAEEGTFIKFTVPAPEPSS